MGTMYLRSVHIRNLKLLRDFRLNFLDSEGQPRMWTVLLGENASCKTSILQAIALSASGPARASQLADIYSLPDKRLEGQKPTVEIEAEFGFSPTFHANRRYPGLEEHKPSEPPRLQSYLEISPGRSDFAGWSRYLGERSGNAALDRLLWGPLPYQLGGPLDEARSQRLPLWFVAGYGTNRHLQPVGVPTAPRGDPGVERLESLWGKRPLLGTGFADLFKLHYGDKSWALEYSQVLRDVVESKTAPLPRVRKLDLRGRGGGGSTANLNESQRIDFEIGGKLVRLAATQLSQGYQAMLAWVADVIGQVFLEANGHTEPQDMEGLLLIDELDLHLHPRWQIGLVKTLRQIFPRMQFVTTTHSPMVLPYLHQSELFLLQPDEQGNITAQPAAQSPAFLTGGGIYAKFFGLPEIFPPELGDLLWRYGGLWASPRRSPDQDAELSRLRQAIIDAGLDPGPAAPGAAVPSAVST